MWRKKNHCAAPLTQFKWLANVSTAFFDKCAKQRRFYAKRKWKCLCSSPSRKVAVTLQPDSLTAAQASLQSQSHHNDALNPLEVGDAETARPSLTKSCAVNKEYVRGWDGDGAGEGDGNDDGRTELGGSTCACLANIVWSAESHFWREVKMLQMCCCFTFFSSSLSLLVSSCLSFSLSLSSLRRDSFGPSNCKLMSKNVASSWLFQKPNGVETQSHMSAPVAILLRRISKLRPQNPPSIVCPSSSL